MTSIQTEAAIRDLYEETRNFYQERVAAMGLHAHGFRILYGPPAYRAPVLFIGYQPGGDAGHMVESQHFGWPNQSDYAVMDWRLAKRVRQVWNASVVERSTGLNAIFFRAPSVAAWGRIPLGLRREMEQFSHDRTLKLIGLLAPEYLVFIGMGTLARFVNEPTDALKLDGRVLIKQSEVSGVPSYGVIHLSGAHIRSSHLSAIRDFFASLA